MQGRLFSQYFLTQGILDTPPCQALRPDDLASFVATLRGIYAQLGASSVLNEAQTESQVIHKVLTALGWGDDFLPQVNLSGKWREDVPDCLLFATPAHKQAALAEAKDERRYRHGLTLLEAKRWLRPLDRGDTTDTSNQGAPSSQMLRYLSRADVVSDRAIKWGLLTNGAVWRLYWQDARSRSEEFFEINVAAALGLSGLQHDMDDIAPDHALRLFCLFFQRPAFLPQSWDDEGRSFHACAVGKARRYQQQVAQDLGQRVFDDIFPGLANALMRGDPDARPHAPDYRDEVREATLVFLYRLLFLFYAEDRHLLPVKSDGYATYSVRQLREMVRDKTDRGTPWAVQHGLIWGILRETFDMIDSGEDALGVPAYNGGLFARSRSALLMRSDVPDAAIAPLIDALSRRIDQTPKEWINYRDLAVSHLGGIYERLLDYCLVLEVLPCTGQNRLVAVPASYARKVSGSYYTHDGLVALVLQESVGALAADQIAAFEAHLGHLARKQSLNPGDWDALDAADPASLMLSLKVCDPAMGSGHFLVALVDFLADRVLEAMHSTAARVNAQPWAAHLLEKKQPWQSPLVSRMAAIRASIKRNATQHGWAIHDEHLDDRHIVRRMILKKCVFGVDKNPMAVELAKTALWLHTFTVGAPFSYLDHHLKVGDSLHGERIDTVQRGLQTLGALLLGSEFERLSIAARALSQVADLTDVDIAEVTLSQHIATEAALQLAPLHAVLDFWRAMRWLVPGWPVNQSDKLAQLFKLPKDPSAREEAIKAGLHPVYAAIRRLLDPDHNLVTVLAAGALDGTDPATQAANDLMAQTRALAARETFFHWQSSFATVFGTGGNGHNGCKGGFDAVIGNPPWEKIKLQQVEWFADRCRDIAAQPRAEDRKKMILALQNAAETQTDSLWAQYQSACARADANARVLGNGKLGCGDYPLLGGGDINLYGLFVERAQSLIHPRGLVALVTPSGIAADKGASEFFRSISSTGRLRALFDFENRKVFFADVHASFKFCVLVFGNLPRLATSAAPDPDPREGQSQPSQALPARCAFYLHDVGELDTPGRVLMLGAQDFTRVNPNTGAAPIFRNQRDADLTLQLYARHPVLMRRGTASGSLGPQADVSVWPVKYATMFHMTSDSRLFLTAEELTQKGWQRSECNRWERKGRGKQANEVQVALPLYEGKMVQMFDHRAADVVVNIGNLMRAAQQEAIDPIEKANPGRYPVPQYWVMTQSLPPNTTWGYCLGFKDVTAPTNMRTMIAAMIPMAAYSNTLPMLLPNEGVCQSDYCHHAALLLANFCSFAYDFIARQKVQGQHLNCFMVEQLPVILPDRFHDPLPSAFAAAMQRAGLMRPAGAPVDHPQPTIADFVTWQVLALTYTANDMAQFARDLGYVDGSGTVLPPWTWDENDRHARLTALDAVFFWLYGLTADDAAYILDSFVIVRKNDVDRFGSYRTQTDILTALQLLAD